MLVNRFSQIKVRVGEKSFDLQHKSQFNFVYTKIFVYIEIRCINMI